MKNWAQVGAELVKKLRYPFNLANRDFTYSQWMIPPWSTILIRSGYRGVRGEPVCFARDEATPSFIGDTEITAEGEHSSGCLGTCCVWG